MKKHWLDKTTYPFRSEFFDVNGQKLHYIDEGSGEIILFVHGTPSWSFDFRHLIKELRRDYRCIAVDHIGFGLSDKPEHYDYSTINHSRTLEKFVLEKQLNNFTLVVHDFGGPIGLNMAMNYPQRIKGLVVLNSWLWSSRSDPEFIKFSKILKSPLLPFLYKYLNFSPGFLLPASFGDHKISPSVHENYTGPFANRKQRNGVFAFAMSLLNDQEWFESIWNKRGRINSKPTLFVWGMKDKFIRPAYLDKFSEGFSNTSIVKIESCGHFPQEEQPEIVTQSIRNFLTINAGAFQSDIACGNK